MTTAGSAPVKADGWQFDLYQVGGWISSHPYVAAAAILVVYAFWISRRDGLLGLFIEDRRAKRELDAKTDLDRTKLLLKYRLGDAQDSRNVPSLAAPATKRRHDRKKDGRRG